MFYAKIPHATGIALWGKDDETIYPLYIRSKKLSRIKAIQREGIVLEILKWEDREHPENELSIMEKILEDIGVKDVWTGSGAYGHGEFLPPEMEMLNPLVWEEILG